MRTFQHIGSLRTYVHGIRSEGKSVGFVPTMGALHEGHVALFQRAASDCDVVVASIFVNPKQFSQGEDFEAYPRDILRDLQIASNEGVAALFQPEPTEMYPEGYETVVDVPHLSSVLEGAHRPTHFQGVATVVTKLLNIIRADRAYFGMKDYQQLLIIERLTRDLNIGCQIVAVPTVRASDGLALSSRNAYLTPEERHAALVVPRALEQAKRYVADGKVDPAELLNLASDVMAQEPLAAADYIALVDPETLQPVSTLEGRVTLMALAVRIGRTRLIDNALIAPPGTAAVRNRAGRA